MTVSAVLTINVTVSCPWCKERLELTDSELGLNDEGNILEMAVPSVGQWIDEHKHFEVNFDCPNCKKEINVKGLEW